jgi:hypothetical protein
MTLNVTARPPRKAGSRVSKVPRNRLSKIIGKPVPTERSHYTFNPLSVFISVQLSIVHEKI